MSNEKITNIKQENKKEKSSHLKRKIFLIVIGVLIIISIIMVVLYYTLIIRGRAKIIDKNTQAIIKQEEVIEYGTKLKYEEILQRLVKTSELSDNTVTELYINDNLINQDQEYTFDKVDNITITVKTSTQIVSFLNEKANVNEQIIWKVQDSKNPTLSGVQDKEIIQGEEFDAKAGITAKDEIDGDLEVTVEGEFDINKVGEYVLVAKAVDKNQNEVKQEFKLTVKEKPEEIVDNNESTESTNNSTTSSNKNTSKTTSSSNKSTTTSNSKSSASSSSSSSQKSNTSASSGSESTKEGRLSLAKAEAKRVVKKIIKPGMTKLQKAEAICQYITSTVSVQTDQSNEAYKTNYGNEAYAALVLKIAACSGRCKAVTLLCDAAGLKSQHINQGQWSHQWNKIQIDDGSWVVIDSQIGFVGDKHPLE